jgi:hypothetical protein
MSDGWKQISIAAGPDWTGATYDFSIVVLVGVCLHVPYDLMGEKLRELRRLNDISLCIPERVVAESLHNLRDIEKGDIDRVALESPHCILEHKWIVPVLGEEERHSRDGADRSPVQEMLDRVSKRRHMKRRRATYL